MTFITTPSQVSIHPEYTSSSATHHLIFMVTGNPGLISYYKTFLHALHPLLGSPTHNPQTLYHIHGQSLAGFVDSPSDPRTIPEPVTHPYSLEDQITFSLASLTALRIPSGPQRGQPYTSVILVGHSVGSYILLEIITRLGRSSHVRIEAGILLFPTVTHIAKSPSGLKISTLFRIPDFAKRVGTLAKGLVLLAPGGVLTWLVGLVTRMPSEAVEVTTQFLKSRMGVWQALHMAKDEMDFIAEDRWDQDIWGIEHEDPDSKSETPPKLIFYFGQNDHWVADHTRDALIAARGREEGARKSSKPIMMIDKGGIPHGFCIRHSETVAEKVGVWINELMADSKY
ncbi:hypothetical protein LZ554_006274 [Drepanopeziza brunnea f. sp. 'monogermtubi']|nr:hypothetical protein LZ554_006274 [Drepanopeziza brunnea f. sp. 'monogermtubi']